MKIYLVKKSYFTFRGLASYDLDLSGITVFERMRRNLCAEACEEERLPSGEKIVLYTAFPFLRLNILSDLLNDADGSFSFRGGFVDRGGEIKTTDVSLPDPVYTLEDYAQATVRAEEEARLFHAAKGAFIEAGASVDLLSVLEEGVIVRSGARIVNSRIRKNATIGTGSLIENSDVGENSKILSSFINNSSVGRSCTVGPFSYMRAGARIGDGCRIGDFVEIKNASLGAGTKAAHLSYIGDAALGKRVNVGCGVVFANYNGKIKQRSSVGDGCFLGSNCNLIAPVNLGEGVFLAAGTTLTRDLDDGDFCIGRSRESVKPKGAEKYL